MEKVKDDQQMPDTEDVEAQQKGIDVSHWQGKIDWNKVAKAGVKHVFMKMTEGGTFVDPLFAVNWQNAKKAGISVNSYHYFTALAATPEQQLENIRKTAKSVNFKPAKNILAIDVEEEGNEKATPLQMATKLNELLNLIKKDAVLSRCTVMIYTSYGYWDTKVAWNEFNFGVYPLWVAHWEVQTPRLPQSWKDAGKTWIWWQYSVAGKVDGIAGAVDLDWVKT